MFFENVFHRFIYKDVVCRISCCLLGVFSLHSAFGARITKDLSHPTVEQSFETADPQLSAFVVKGTTIYTIPTKQNHILSLRFDLSGHSRGSRFTPLVEQPRIPLPERRDSSSGWTRRNLYLVEKTLHTLDGDNLEVERFSEALQSISKQSLVYDTVRPAADKGGEAPIKEQESLRKSFVDAVHHFRGERFSGVVSVPSAWHKQKGSQDFFVVTRLKEFPLVMLTCGDEFTTQCSVSRACRVEGLKGSEDLVAVAVHPTKRWILVGEKKSRKENYIHVIAYESCYSSRLVETMGVSERISIAGLHVDSDSRLWIASSDFDSYTNGSIFYWQASSWLAN